MKNQYTYSAASPGVLKMTLRVKVEPAAAAVLIASQCRFTVGAIGNSTMTWAPENPNGKPVAVNGTLNAEVTFSNLPANNDDFIWKWTTLEWNSQPVASNKYGVFFPMTAANHPPCSTCPGCPNWFWYWRQGGVCGIPANAVYSNASYYGAAHLEVGNYFIRLGRIAATTNNGPETYTNSVTLATVMVTGNGKGIQCVAETIQHEWGHINIHRVAYDPTWQTPGVSYHDNDGDYVPDVLEPTLMGIATLTNNPNTFQLPPPYPSYGDSEIRCRLLELDLQPVPIYPVKDWANPGCQHKNQFGPQAN